MKKWISLCLTLLLCAGLATPACAAGFSDVPAGHYAAGAIGKCVDKGVVSGYNNGTFRPNATLTRAQFCVMLSRAFFASYIEKYKDPIYISSGIFWANYQAMMANQALNNTSFADDTDNVQEMSRSISRYDMAQLITNIMTRQGFPASSSDKSAAIAKITDYNTIPSQYRDAVANVYALGIITGYSDGSFSGEVTMNRGQAAVVIYRMMQYSGNSGGNITNPDPETPAEPETPSKPSQPDQTGKTLTNGKPVTEANILELLSELQAKYPEHTSFVNGYRDGIKSYDVLKVTNTYDRAKGGKTSTSAGCGGWAALVSDYIFGQTGFPARKIATADARPGDIGISVDSNGKLTHVFIVTSRAQHNDECQWTEFDGTDSNTTGPNNTYEIIWDVGHADWDNPQPGDWTVDVWTRYPN